MRQSVMSEQSKAWIYNPADQGQSVEVIHWSYYDYKTINGLQNGTVSVAASNSFFNTPSGTPVGAGVNTKEDSNIPKPLSVGSPYKFLIQEVAFVIMPVGRSWYAVDKAAAPDKRFEADVVEMLSRGVATLKVLGVDRLECSPLITLPAGVGSIGNQDGMFANGWPVLSNRYPVEIALHKDTTFEMLIDFPKGTFPIYNAIKFGVIFDGLLQRPTGK